MTFEFGSYSAGLIAAAIVAAVTVIAVFRQGIKKSLSAQVLWLLSGAALAFAIADPKMITESEFERATVLVDISDSMEEGIADSLLKQVHRFEESGMKLQYIPFAAEAAQEPQSSLGDRAFNQVKRSFQRLDVGKTDIEQALERATEFGGGNVLLVSDGRESSGNIERIFDRLKNSNVRVYPILPNEPQAQSAASVGISNLSVPLVAAQKQSVKIRTSLKNSTQSAQSGTLEVKHDTKVVLSKRIELKAGQESVIETDSDPDLDGMREVVSTFTPDNTSFAPTVARAFLSSRERERILVLSGTGADRAVLDQVLQSQAYQLTSVVAGSGEFAKLEDLNRYSSIVLNNIPKNALPFKVSDQLPEYVRAGGGFIMVGGDKSFGLGGYIGSSIEKILPVELVPPQTTKKRLNVAVALVLDKSGSMQAGGKLDFAKEAAREVVRNLKDDDYITVIGFDDAPFVVIGAARVGDVRSKADDRISRLYSAGRTNLLPAIEEARRGLAKVDAGRKHMIVLTDGRIPDEGPFYLEITKQMRLIGVTLSTVLLGGESEFGFLKSLADAGGGGFYQTYDARNLPRIFLQDVKTSTGERTMKESQEYLVREGPAEIESTSLREFPALRGYVETKKKAGANLELVVLAEDKAEPLLASWKVGSGKAVAFTSDANGRWSNRWVEWSGFAAFWSDLLDSVRKKDENSEQQFDLRYSVEHGSLVMELSLFGDKDPGAASAQLTLPKGPARDVVFERVSAGRYRASVDDITAGKFELRMTTGKSTKLTPVAFYLGGELFGEVKGEGFNLPLIYGVASKTGGVVNPSVQDLKVQPQIERTETPLNWLALLCAMLFFVTWAIARERSESTYVR